jgi:hypothetical protein
MNGEVGEMGRWGGGWMRMISLKQTCESFLNEMVIYS